mmetsp:Transcript_16533/g.18487  ORF Transcript_16533/g.18487 Transcript_16533/m.18487 type:complete len:202 (-) Transcript_16533:534-1139(-)
MFLPSARRSRGVLDTCEKRSFTCLFGFEIDGKVNVRLAWRITKSGHPFPIVSHDTIGVKRFISRSECRENFLGLELAIDPKLRSFRAIETLILWTGNHGGTHEFLLLGQIRYMSSTLTVSNDSDHLPIRFGASFDELSPSLTFIHVIQVLKQLDKTEFDRVFWFHLIPKLGHTIFFKVRCTVIATINSINVLLFEAVDLLI